MIIREAIRHYKIYLLQNIVNNPAVHIIEKSITTIDKNQKIGKLYEMPDLMNEYVDFLSTLPKNRIEANQYYNVFQSFSHRLEQRESPNDASSKYAWKRFRRIVTKKLKYIYGDQKVHDVVNLKTFLELIEKEINKLNEFNKEANALELGRKFNKNIKKKIDSQHVIIYKHLLPSMTKTFQEIDQTTKTLIREIVTARIQTTKKIENKEKLKEQLKLQTAFSVIQTISQALPYIGPAGSIAGTYNKTFFFFSPY